MGSVKIDRVSSGLLGVGAEGSTALNRRGAGEESLGIPVELDLAVERVDLHGHDERMVEVELYRAICKLGLGTSSDDPWLPTEPPIDRGSPPLPPLGLYIHILAVNSIMDVTSIDDPRWPHASQRLGQYSGWVMPCPRHLEFAWQTRHLQF